MCSQMLVMKPRSWSMTSTPAPIAAAMRRTWPTIVERLRRRSCPTSARRAGGSRAAAPPRGRSRADAGCRSRACEAGRSAIGGETRQREQTRRRRRRRGASGDRWATRSATATFSRTESDPNTRRFWNVRATPWRARRVRGARQRPIAEVHRSRGRLDEPGEQVDEGGLARRRSVRSGRWMPPGLDRDGHIVDRGEPAEDHPEPVVSQPPSGAGTVGTSAVDAGRRGTACRRRGHDGADRPSRANHAPMSNSPSRPPGRSSSTASSEPAEEQVGKAVDHRPVEAEEVRAVAQEPGDLLADGDERSCRRSRP